jgi:5-methylcytosine-specific restriction endonuclease McrBC regulatory subunit McrC
MAMISLVDNYYLSILEKKTKKEIENANGYYGYYDSLKKIEESLNITLKDYQNKKYPNNTFFSFFKDKEKRDAKNVDDLIITIKNDGASYIAQTGNYIGKFVWQGLEIDIKSRFSNAFLERMLNFANDIFLDDVSITGNKIEKKFDISKYIIYYMFVQKLEKAFLLGLPKSYKSIEHHEMKLKGKIDINKFIKYDIPFKGKISTVSREQKEIQEIIDVLNKAVKIVEKNNNTFTKNISHIKTHLKQYRSNCFVSNETIRKSLQSKTLQNPIFAPYKKVLEYAKFIINGNNIEEKSDGKSETYGFIINVAELFEIYVTKLLQKEFSDWSVSSPKIELYDNPKMFYKRKIIPDIVMTKDNDVMVFDTKYKRMKMRGTEEQVWDVDRNDFFQINTYLSYYQNQRYQVKVGGLLYPMEKFDEVTCHSGHWLGNNQTKFIVDGIELNDGRNQSKEITRDELLYSETKFIERIQGIISDAKPN